MTRNKDPEKTETVGTGMKTSTMKKEIIKKLKKMNYM